jgi:hypothetical protein
MIRSSAGQHRLRMAASIACSSVALLFAAPSWASHVGEIFNVDQQLISANNQMLAALAQWQKAPPALRASGVAQLTQLAQHRQEHLVLLLQQSPGVAAARLMPRSLRAKLPPQAAAYVEEEVQVQGTAIAHVADDFANARSRSSFKLHGNEGTVPLNVYLADPVGSERDLHAMSGKRASFEAVRIGDNLLILDRRKIQIEAAGSTTASGGTLVAAGSAVQGNQNTLSILLNFSDRSLTCSAADVEARLFGASGATVNNNYRESSRGVVSFSGRAIGPFTINYTSAGSCDYSGWAAAANAAAKAAGFDPALYQRVNYVTPSNSSCGWTGLAYMPGKQSWVQACGATGVFSHELGHNLSLHHASTPSSEYGDGSDPMGGARMVDHNGANRTMAGWMPAGSVLDVGTGSSYALATVSTNASSASPQVLRIVKPDTHEYYYVSVRQALNLDAGLSSGYLDNVSVHRSTGTLPARTFLLQNLASGQTFSDSANGISITNQGVVNGIATVAVGFNGGSCVRSAPVVSISPSSQIAAPGSTVGYGVTVTNRNTVYCGTSSFNMGQALPANFGGSFSAPTLAVGAGASASTSWTVSTSSQIAAGTYTLDVTATESSVGNSTTAHATEIVYVDTVPPVVSITSPAANAVVSGRVGITATASDDTALRAVEFYVDEVLIGRDTGPPFAANWNSRKAAAGLHLIRVRAIDASGNVTDQTISVSAR